MKLSRTLFALAVVATLSGCGSKGTPTAADPTLDTTPPAAPTSLRVTTDPTTNQSTLSWDPSAAVDLSGYEVWVALNGSPTYTLASQGGFASYDMPEVENITAYDYRVRAFDQTGNRSAYSNTLQVQLRPWQAAGNPGDPTHGRMDP